MTEHNCKENDWFGRELVKHLKENMTVTVLADAGKLFVRVEYNDETIAEDSIHVCDVISEQDNY